MRSRNLMSTNPPMMRSMLMINLPIARGGKYLRGGIEHFFHILFRFCSDEAVHRLASFKENERGDAHDVELPRGLGVFVYVHLHDLYFSFVLLREFLDDREHHLAGAAPWGPEVDENGNLRLEDFCIEICVRNRLCHAHRGGR